MQNYFLRPTKRHRPTARDSNIFTKNFQNST